MTRGRKRNTDEDGKEDLRGEVRRLRKEVAQLRRENEKLMGIQTWGFLGRESTRGEEQSDSPSNRAGLRVKEPSGVEGKPVPKRGKARKSQDRQCEDLSGTSDKPSCPKCSEPVIVLVRPDGSSLIKCPACLYRQLKQEKME